MKDPFGPLGSIKERRDNLANAKYPLLHYDAYANHNQRLNSFFLKNGAFARLKNVEVSYRLPTDWSEKVGMSECRLYVNGNNLLTWDHLNGLTDPESNGSNRYPIMKTVNFALILDSNKLYSYGKNYKKVYLR